MLCMTLPKTVLFWLSCVLPPTLFAQCYYSTSIGTSKDYCLGSTLRLMSTHPPRKIVWYRNGQAIDSVSAAESFSNTGKIVASRDNELLYGICTDENDNLYLATGDNTHLKASDYVVLKYTPATPANGGFVVAGGNGVGSAANQLDGPSNPFVDANGNLFVVDFNNSRIQEWTTGATSGATVIHLPPELSANGDRFYFDCDGNIYGTPGGNASIVEWPRGSTAPKTVVQSTPNGNSISLGKDAAGNLFAGNGGVDEWPPGATTPIRVTPGN